VTEPLRARPCPLCEALAEDAHEVVTTVWMAQAFWQHMLERHPGFDPASAWAMPLPTGRRAARAVLP
jgi:hypothetical protein